MGTSPDNTLDEVWHRTPLNLRNAAERASDGINTIVATHSRDDIISRYIGIHLQNGRLTPLYDSWKDASKHLSHNAKLYYILSFLNMQQGTKPREMAVVLDFARRAYKAGASFTDPDEVRPEIARQSLMTTAQMDYSRSRLFQPTENEIRAFMREHEIGGKHA